MIAALLIAAALAVLFAKPASIAAASEAAVSAAKGLTVQHAAAAALVVAAVVVSLPGGESVPTPAPPAGDLVLTGRFVGPTAAADAATVSALSEELASEIEWDGMQSDPLLKTGVAFDELRTRARELRLRGESIGARQPQVRDAIHGYLDRTVGVSGGPVSSEQRATWVAALREIGRAASDAAR